MGHLNRDPAVGSQALQTIGRKGQTVVGADKLPVGRVVEDQGQDALLLQVGLGDAGETASDDRPAAQEAGRHGGVLAAGALTVVDVAHGHPAQAPGLVAPGQLVEGYLVIRLPLACPRGRISSLPVAVGNHIHTVTRCWPRR